jgi:NACalpha-BTF3-like transcription factor
MESKDEKVANVANVVNNSTNSESEYETESDRELIFILMRQTTYTKKEAIQSLKENNNDIEKCIEHFLEIPPKKDPEMSVNQKIFKNIRDNM